MAQSDIHAGFPSPATDYMTQAIDLNKELVKHPAATFYGRVVGDSMIDAGVEEGDILVIDKSLEPQDGDMAVCFIDGEFTLKHLRFSVELGTGGRKLTLVPANDRYPSIEVKPVLFTHKPKEVRIWMNLKKCWKQNGYPWSALCDFV